MTDSHRPDAPAAPAAGETPAAAASPAAVPPMRLSGLEPVTLGEGHLFVNIGERTNVTGSGRSRR